MGRATQGSYASSMEWMTVSEADNFNFMPDLTDMDLSSCIIAQGNILPITPLSSTVLEENGALGIHLMIC